MEFLSCVVFGGFFVVFLTAKSYFQCFDFSLTDEKKKNLEKYCLIEIVRQIINNEFFLTMVISLHIYILGVIKDLFVHL